MQIRKSTSKTTSIRNSQTKDLRKDKEVVVLLVETLILVLCQTKIKQMKIGGGTNSSKA
jgi:hypothetical protein